MTKPFVAVEGQSFATFDDWVDTATDRLTSHPEYNETSLGGHKGWRGYHFTALCFDQKGNYLRNGGHFMNARDAGTFPVWWVWPDQIAALLMRGGAGE